MYLVSEIMDKFVLDTFDMNTFFKVESGKMWLKEGIYKINTTGSFYREWTGEKWIYPPIQTEIEHILNKKFKENKNE